jgi:hypothetical protein
VRRRGSHIFITVGSHMAVRLLASRAGRPLTLENSLYSFLLEAESTSRAIVRPEELHQLKYSMTLSEIEPATFPLVA